MPANKKSLFARPSHKAEGQTFGPDVDQWVAKGEAVAQSQQAVPPPPEASTSEGPPLPKPPESVEVPKPEGLKRLTIDIPKSLHARVKSACAENEESIADVVRKLLEKKFPDPSKQKHNR